MPQPATLAALAVVAVVVVAATHALCQTGAAAYEPLEFVAQFNSSAARFEFAALEFVFVDAVAGGNTSGIANGSNYVPLGLGDSGVPVLRFHYWAGGTNSSDDSGADTVFALENALLEMGSDALALAFGIVDLAVERPPLPAPATLAPPGPPTTATPPPTTAGGGGSFALRLAFATRFRYRAADGALRPWFNNTPPRDVIATTLAAVLLGPSVAANASDAQLWFVPRGPPQLSMFPAPRLRVLVDYVQAAEGPPALDAVYSQLLDADVVAALCASLPGCAEAELVAPAPVLMTAAGRASSNEYALQKVTFVVGLIVVGLAGFGGLAYLWVRTGSGGKP